MCKVSWQSDKTVKLAIWKKSFTTDRQTDKHTNHLYISSANCKPTAELKQELSYRKQIARQLRTQFVENISVTLKSTLRATQGHWKWNHWTDHTRLSIRRVNWTLNIIVTLKCGSEVTQDHWKWYHLKVLVRFPNFSYPNPNHNPNPNPRVSRSLKWRRSITICDFLLVRHWKYSSILYHFLVIWRWIISWPWNRGCSRSLKLVPLKSLSAVSYSPSIVTMAVSVAVCKIFSVKDWCDLENGV